MNIIKKINCGKICSDTGSVNGLITELSLNELRNNYLADVIKQVYQSGKNIICLGSRLPQINILCDMLNLPDVIDKMEITGKPIVMCTCDLAVPPSDVLILLNPIPNLHENFLKHLMIIDLIDDYELLTDITKLRFDFYQQNNYQIQELTMEMQIYNCNTHSKLIGCSIHGHIRVSPLALKIIDTEEFQRLRHIKQLGLCVYVYPAATHTRFEHSLGVYHLAWKVLEKLQKNYPNKIYDIPELGPTKLTDFVADLVAIGGLLHDVGHGPFSHIFDDMMWSITYSPNAKHEYRSCLIVEHICKKYLPELSDTHVKFIQSVINPGVQHQGALYQIISNYLNGIDVDKFDYLARDSHALGLKRGFDPRKIIDEIIIDSNGNIAYAKHCSIEIYDLFQTRYLMHKQVYNHKTVKIIEVMLSDIIKKVDPIFNISCSIYDMERFCKLTDNSIFDILEANIIPSYHLQTQLSLGQLNIVKSAYDTYLNITRRNLYKCIAQISDITPNHFVNFLSTHDFKDHVEIISINIGFTSTKKNPFDSIYFYDKKETCTSSFLLSKNQISFLLSNDYTEVQHFLICKNPIVYQTIMNAYRSY